MPRISQQVRETYATAGTSPVILCGYDETRVCLIVASLAGGAYFGLSTMPILVTPGSSLAWAGGNGMMPVILTKQDHGLLVNQQWYGVTNGAAVGPTLQVIELLQITVPDRDQGVLLPPTSAAGDPATDPSSVVPDVVSVAAGQLRQLWRKMRGG